MKKNMKSSSILLGGLFLLGAVCSCTQTAPDYASYVNPFIGTGGHGHTYPGAVVPNGMIQPSPDTRIYEWDACSGYYYADTTINGFSHTHVSGTGCADYGDVLLMPTVGRQDYHSMGSKSQQMAYASAFSHENETAEPGYYSVFLDRYGVKAELTSTKRAAIHRYTFPKAEDAGFILDLDYNEADLCIVSVYDPWNAAGWSVSDDPRKDHDIRAASCSDVIHVNGHFLCKDRSLHGKYP